MNTRSCVNPTTSLAAPSSIHKCSSGSWWCLQGQLGGLPWALPHLTSIAGSQRQKELSEERLSPGLGPLASTHVGRQLDTSSCGQWLSKLDCWCDTSFHPNQDARTQAGKSRLCFSQAIASVHRLVILLAIFESFLLVFWSNQLPREHPASTKNPAAAGLWRKSLRLLLEGKSKSNSIVKASMSEANTVWKQSHWWSSSAIAW